MGSGDTTCPLSHVGSGGGDVAAPRETEGREIGENKCYREGEDLKDPSLAKFG